MRVAANGRKTFARSFVSSEICVGGSSSASLGYGPPRHYLWLACQSASGVVAGIGIADSLHRRTRPGVVPWVASVSLWSMATSTAVLGATGGLECIEVAEVAFPSERYRYLIDSELDAMTIYGAHQSVPTSKEVHL